MGISMNSLATQPKAHKADSKPQAHPASATNTHKTHAQTGGAAPTAVQAATALHHVTAAVINKAARSTQTASAADRDELQRRVTAARYAGGPASVAASAAANKSAASSAARTRDRIVLDAGRGRDNIEIFRKEHGGLEVKVNGKSHDFSAAESRRLTVRSGDGNDRIFVGRGVRTDLTLEGGKGDDRIIGGDGADRIRGGAGRDYINGGRGNDRLDGNGGYDVIYGGLNNDRISGGRGNDYCDGGTGRDLIDGGSGRDILSGGRGNDTLRGSAGNDHLYAGLGRDRLYGSAGDDQLYAQRGSDRVRGGAGDDAVHNLAVRTGLGHSIKVEGSDRFRERVNADLDLLRSSPDGQKMLRALDRAAARGNVLRIRETSGSGGNVTVPAGGVYQDPHTGKKTRVEDTTVFYDPSRTKIPGNAAWEKRPPVVGLYHEMVHGYNFVTGTAQPGVYRGPGPDGHMPCKRDVPNLERQAVGLPIDHDHNRHTPPRTVNAPALTENGLRSELGLPRRPSYRLS